MVELADTQDLGSCGRPCRFESCYPHHLHKHLSRRCFFYPLIPKKYSNIIFSKEIIFRQVYMKRISFRIILIILCMTLVFAFPVSAFGEDDFDAFLTDEWKEMMESDYLTMHYSVLDYESMGLTKPEVTLGDLDYDSYPGYVKDAKKSLDKLHEFDPDQLTESQRTDYLVYERDLENYIGMYSFTDFQEMFRPYVGVMTNIVDSFMDFPLTDRQDVEDYLTVLSEFPSFIDKMKDLTEKQASKGYFLDDYDLDTELEELDDFVKKGEDNTLISVFETALRKVPGLSDEEKAAFSERNREIVLDHILPAYEKLEDFLESLRGSRTAGSAVCDLEGGEEYYRWLARSETSSDASLEDMFEYLTKAAKEAYAYLSMVNVTEPGEEGSIEGMETSDEVLEYLRDHMEGFPEGPDISYETSKLDPDLGDWIMAYYIQNPIDDIERNVIRTNDENIGDDIIVLYYTLAHEGFPGHMYQFTWCQDQGYNPIRHDIVVTGYEEGWANYVERIMLQRSGLGQKEADFIYMGEFLDYVIQAGADIAVNGLGYDTEKLGKWLDSIFDGLGDEAEGIYEYSTSMPGGLLPYGYGMAKFWEFRERVQEALGEDFDLEEFHRVVLTGGQRPFELVETDLKEYVESKGKTLPEEFTFFTNTAVTHEDIGDEALDGDDMYYSKGHTVRILISVISVIAVILIAVILTVIIKRKRRIEIIDEVSEEEDV